MNNFELTWYMHEIAMHGMGAEIEYNKMLECLGNPDTRQSRLVWLHLTSFLSHAAMISKYLSPIGGSEIKNQRKNELCRILEIEGDSSVLPRNARDNIEHFDERIDNWIGSETTINEVVVDNRQDYERIGIGDQRVKRVLLHDELIFISENRDGSKFEIELEPVFIEISRVSQRSVSWIEESSPYHFIYPNAHSSF